MVVEVGTRKLDPEQRESALAESLSFARLHLEARSTDAAPLDVPAHSPLRTRRRKGTA